VAIDIPRYLIEQRLAGGDLLPGKVVLLLGPRRVGKTVGLRRLLTVNPQPTLWLNGEEDETREALGPRSIARYRELLAGYTRLVLDEAHAVPNVGAVLKLMHDEVPGVQIIATGSSATQLLHGAGQPLTGRATLLRMYPIAQLELKNLESPLDTLRNRDTRLRLGSYPELFQLDTDNQRTDYLRDLVVGQLLQDILAFEDLRRPQKLRDLLSLLALQIGNEVSTPELGQQLSMSKDTVQHYLELLEQAFIIFRVGGYSRNLRKEVSKSKRWYFVDNGVRNAVLGDYRPLAVRDGRELGQLWENYLATERIKRNDYLRAHAEAYYWRTVDQQEIDWVEENEQQQLAGFEFKWAVPRRTRAPIAFAKAYPDTPFRIVTHDSYLDFIGG